MDLSRLFKFQEILLLLRASKSTSKKVCFLLVFDCCQTDKINSKKSSNGIFLISGFIMHLDLPVYPTPEDLTKALIQGIRQNAEASTCVNVCKSLKVTNTLHTHMLSVP